MRPKVFNKIQWFHSIVSRCGRANDISHGVAKKGACFTHRINVGARYRRL